MDAMALVALLQLTIVLVLAWPLVPLMAEAASLLHPCRQAAVDRWRFARIPRTRLQLRVLLHLVATYTIILPVAIILWCVDELLFPKYRAMKIRAPIIIVSVPRAGTTSFHRTFALDEDQLVTPTMLELFLPFICIQKLVWKLHYCCPDFVERLEAFLKRLNGVTQEVDSRHPVHLLVPDADDILIGEWHWLSVGSLRTFPVSEHWKKHYQMINTQERTRSLTLHQRVCQKILYNRGPHKRLLLRSHLSPCVADFQRLYPLAIFVGIVRDPVAVLESFAGLSSSILQASMGVDLLAKKDDNTPTPWPQMFVEILSNMMGREAELYSSAIVDHSVKSCCCYVTFDEFRKDPIASLQEIYTKAGLRFTLQTRKALWGYQLQHESYKKRHVYHNPTLQDMEIDETRFRNLPSVWLYAQLLKKRAKRKS